jgi:hypothetical protein
VGTGGTAAAPEPTVEESLTNGISGIALAPSGITIAVKTKFTAGSGTPKAAKGAFAALSTSFAVGNGSAFGAPLGGVRGGLICHGAALDLRVSGGNRHATVDQRIFRAEETVPDKAVCGALPH